MNDDETLGFLYILIEEKIVQIKKLQTEMNMLHSIRLLYQKSQAKTHEFENENDLKDAMQRNFNHFDTFIIKEKKDE